MTDLTQTQKNQMLLDAAKACDADAIKTARLKGAGSDRND